MYLKRQFIYSQNIPGERKGTQRSAFPLCTRCAQTSRNEEGGGEILSLF